MPESTAGEFYDAEPHAAEELPQQEAANGRIRWGRMQPLQGEEEDRRGTPLSLSAASLGTHPRR